MYSLILGTTVLVVLSSDQAIKDLLDKRSSIYSSRPDLYLSNIVSGFLRVVLMVRISQKTSVPWDHPPLPRRDRLTRNSDMENSGAWSAR